MTEALDPTAGFRASYRVRFDEAGPDGALRASGLLRYTQDVAARHSEALGYDRAWYAARRLTWLVRTAELEIGAAIPYGSVLAGTTRVVGFRRVWSRRETTFALPDGSTAATVRIDWVLLDEDGSPTRIPAEFETVFAAPPATLQLARVSPGEPPPDAARMRFRVRPQELDPLDHVNNGAYADWLDEAILEAHRADGDRVGAGPPPTSTIPRRMRLEYARAAELGESLEGVSWRAADGWSCLIARAGDGAELLRGRLELLDGRPTRAS